MSGVLIFVLAYFLGSIPFGYLIARYFGGRDIRTVGSGNIGAANVSRSLGLAAGFATLALDAAKGVAAVWLAARIGGNFSFPLALGAIGAIGGHLFPYWLNFRGGKGVATAIGAFFVIGWLAVAADLCVWVIAMAIWRYASLSSMLWAALLPLSMYWLYAPGHHPPQSISVAAVVAALLILWRHRPNLQRLIEGKEPRMHFRRHE